MNKTVKPFHRQPLGPDQLKVAGKAFEGALEHCAEVENDMHPLAVRKVLASVIMREALAGEQDEARLQQEALDQLERTARTQAAHAGQANSLTLEARRKPLG